MRLKIRPEHIERWIARHFPNYKKRAHGKQLTINNPFCSDTGFHLWISLEQTSTKTFKKSNYYVHDWRSSEYNMSFLSFVKRYLKVSYFEAIRDVADGDNSLHAMLTDARKGVEDEEDVEKVEEEIKLPDLTRYIEGSNDKICKLALNYLNNRMISKELAIEYKLGYTPSTIVFPYIEFGVLVYWQERSFLGKSFNFPSERSTGLAKTDFLYNFDNVEQPGGDVVIVESIINCINVGEGCVASGGAALAMGSRQIKKLKALDPRLVVFAPDFDRAGVFSLLDNFSLLRKEFDCDFAYCLPPEIGLDWNDLEKRDGIGTARRYIEMNSSRLDIRNAIMLREKIA